MRKVFLPMLCFLLAPAMIGCGAAKQPDKADAVFCGEIIEINDEVMVIELLEGYPQAEYAEKVHVAIQHMPGSPEPVVGDVIEITYSGIMMEEDPPSPAGVTKVTVVKDAQ